jgi:hypothetical protein
MAGGGGVAGSENPVEMQADVQRARTLLGRVFIGLRPCDASVAGAS